jgi:hypothetical protein
MTYQEAKKYLKEGMRVKIWFEDGDTYIKKITKLDGNEIWGVNEDWLPGEEGFYVATPDTKMEILTNPDGSNWVHPDEQNQEFKVGDRVRLHKAEDCCNCGWMESFHNKEVILSKKRGEHGFYFNDKGEWAVCRNWLEKIEEPKTAREVLISARRAGKNYFAEAFLRNYQGFESTYINQPIKLFTGVDFGYESKPKRKTFMSSATEFVKKRALKLNNPDEFELREAGIHDSCGDLTSDGESLRDQFLEELVHAKLVETAKAINAEKKEKK